MKKWFALIPAAVLMVLAVHADNVSEILDPSDLSITTDRVTIDYFIIDPNASSDAVIVGYTGQGGNVVIPETLEDYAVTGIASDAFSSQNTANADSITSVTIPESVLAIGSGAFYGVYLTNLYVAAGNPSYMEPDGVLFTADGTTLHQ